jgi:hypothetical protein
MSSSPSALALAQATLIGLAEPDGFLRTVGGILGEQRLYRGTRPGAAMAGDAVLPSRLALRPLPSLPVDVSRGGVASVTGAFPFDAASAAAAAAAPRFTISTGPQGLPYPLGRRRTATAMVVTSSATATATPTALAPISTTRAATTATTTAAAAAKSSARRLPVVSDDDSDVDMMGGNRYDEVATAAVGGATYGEWAWRDDEPLPASMLAAAAERHLATMTALMGQQYPAAAAATATIAATTAVAPIGALHALPHTTAARPRGGMHEESDGEEDDMNHVETLGALGGLDQRGGEEAGKRRRLGTATAGGKP